MKQIYTLIAGLILFLGCTPDDLTIYNHSVGKEDIKILELRADHKTLVPNGIAQMKFYVKAYGVRDFLKYTDGKVQDTLTYTEEMVKDTFEIPADLLPQGYLKVYDEDGQELEDNIFSTNQTGVRTINFYAEAGGLKSKPLPITIRELPDENYSEVVIPVIFHVVVPPASSGPTYSISVEELQKKLDWVNSIFNRKVTTDPNGGNTKIVFKLAEYNKSGARLVEKGKNQVTLTTALTSTTEYTDYITKNLIWDPTRFMNVWVAKFSNSIAETSTYTYKAAAPTIRKRGTEPIKGITTKEVDAFNIKDGYTYLESGFMVNYHEFLNPNSWSSNSFEVATVFAAYFGLKVTEYISYTTSTNNIVDGDTDYCPDTYYYYPSGQSYIYKSTDLGKYSTGEPIEYFTSFNIMDRYSRKNSVSVDQAARIREVLEKCPSRWSYKSDFAFTGKK